MIHSHTSNILFRLFRNVVVYLNLLFDWHCSSEVYESQSHNVCVSSMCRIFVCVLDCEAKLYAISSTC